VANGADVDIAGGASAVRPGFTPVEVVPTPYATHLRYRVGH
jgi:hypothetical protein